MGMTNALNLLCGLALFLYGMHVMGEGLTRASGGRLEGILESLTKSKIKAVLLGAGVTAVIQSSSATTVMVVGFVNSGIMRLSRRRANCTFLPTRCAISSIVHLTASCMMM